MKSTLTLLTALLLAPGAVQLATDEAAPQRPNVLIVITDDQGYGELSCHGNPVLQTPHLDQLRSESIRFTDFHVAPMCTPTRGQFMTGVDALRNGASNVSSGRTLLRRGFPTMSDLFAHSGWSTGLFGKWHLGDTYPYRPQDRGFQETDKELYNLQDDPLQEHNVFADHPEVVAVMRSHLDQWWNGVKEHANDFEASVIGNHAENPVQLTACEWADVFIDQQAQVRRGDRKNGLWHINVAAAGVYAFTLSRWPDEARLRLRDGIEETRVMDGVLASGLAWPVGSARIRVGDVEQRAKVDAESGSVRFEMPLPAGRTTLQTWLDDESGGEIGGAYYVTVERLQTKPPVKLILDTDMSGDADDAGTLAMLHAMADRGECELLATIVNRADLTNASAAAVDAINTYYGRPNIPIGTDKVGPTALQRTSRYTPGLRDGFPNDIGPDDKAPDALDVYRRVLAAQPDGSVTVCSVGALSNLAELWRREPALVRAKIRRVVVMGGQFPPAAKPETNIATHPEAARLVAAKWPTEIVWQGFEVGNPVFTGEALKRTPVGNPARRAFELRLFGKRPSIEGGQPSYDQAAAFYAVRGTNAELWSEEHGGRVVIDEQGFSRWVADATSPQVMVTRICVPDLLARQIEALMIAPPKNPTTE